MGLGTDHVQCFGHSSAEQSKVLHSFNDAAEQDALEQQKPTHKTIDSAVLVS